MPFYVKFLLTDMHTIEFLTAAIQTHSWRPFKSNIFLCVTSHFFSSGIVIFYTPSSLPNRKPALPVILIREEPCFPGHQIVSQRQDIHEGPAQGIYISLQNFPLHLPACQVIELLCCQREDNGCHAVSCLLHTQCFWPFWGTRNAFPQIASFTLPNKTYLAKCDNLNSNFRLIFNIFLLYYSVNHHRHFGRLNNGTEAPHEG